MKIRKQFILDPEKIHAVREITGAGNDTEAINSALELVIANARIKVLLSSIKGKGKIRDVYGRTTDKDNL